jgi:hypothetical protein
MYHLHNAGKVNVNISLLYNQTNSINKPTDKYKIIFMYIVIFIVAYLALYLCKETNRK